MESFINGVDSQMRQRQELQKLAATSARVEAYEAVEGASEEVERVRTELKISFILLLIWGCHNMYCNVSSEYR